MPGNRTIPQSILPDTRPAVFAVLLSPLLPTGRLPVHGGPVGAKTIAISVGEEVRTIEDVYEPYLIQIGFVKRTPQGREVTSAAKKHLNNPQKTLV